MQNVYVIVEKDIVGFIAMADEIREESYEAVKILRDSGLKLHMMTGDNEKVAKSVSDELGLDGYFAGILSDQKLEKIKEFQREGEFVAMTGDGINNAPALATADVGIAVVDPVASMQAIENGELHKVAKMVKGKLERVISNIN